MNNLQKLVCYLFLVLSLIFGSGMLLAPGRLLGLVYWAPIDPHITRLLGAALLAIAWLAWRMVNSNDQRINSVGAEVLFAFTSLSTIGLLRHVLVAYYPPVVWFLTITLLLFAVYWGIFWNAIRPRRG